MGLELVRAESYLHAAYDRVWRALTQPAEQEAWYVAPCLAFGWEPGERVAWGQPEQPIIEGVLTRWTPARHFAYQFEFTSLAEPPSLVEWQVQPMGEVVWVEVRHLFEREAPETQAIVTDGWPLVLARLKTLLETGRVMPWPEQEEEVE